MIGDRSLERVEVHRDEDGNPVLLMLCDCGTVTELTVDIERARPGSSTQFAYTCDSCLSAHWFTVALGEPIGGGDG